MREPVMHGKASNYRRARRARLAVRLGGGACAIAGAAALAAAPLAASAATPAAGTVRSASPHDADRATSSARPAFAVAAAGAVSPWIHIAAGRDATCGIREGNTLWCWGAGRSGALGTGHTAEQDEPQQITRPTAGWASVTLGLSDGCATRSDGTLWCWGYNGYGELGIGTTTSVSRPHQVAIPASTGWTSVTAGVYHTCATRSDATLWCWGYNGVGQLGTGTTTSQDQPQQVTTPAGTGWASVSAGGSTTCATRSDGTLWCWGFNNNGELGIGTTTSQDQPRQVTTPVAGGWTSVTAGAQTCATRSDTTLWCWGWNGFGQLGIGTTTDQDQPQQVTTPASTGWTRVTAGGAHTCATRTHALWCWGWNGYGQLGNGTYADQARPRRVFLPTTTGWTLMALGEAHTCATHTGHTLWCWGFNSYGQLGIGTTTSQNLPQQVTS
jgi:alpha-tubulin suppressor-like RCC1 family protein